MFDTSSHQVDVVYITTRSQTYETDPSKSKKDKTYISIPPPPERVVPSDKPKLSIPMAPKKKIPDNVT